MVCYLSPHSSIISGRGAWNQIETNATIDPEAALRVGLVHGGPGEAEAQDGQPCPAVAQTAKSDRSKRLQELPRAGTASLVEADIRPAELEEDALQNVEGR